MQRSVSLILVFTALAFAAFDQKFSAGRSYDLWDETGEGPDVYAGWIDVNADGSLEVYWFQTAENVHYEWDPVAKNYKDPQNHADKIGYDLVEQKYTSTYHGTGPADRVPLP